MEQKLWKRKKELMTLYNSTAGGYDRRYRELQKYKFEEIRKYVVDSARILDVGCGTGLALETIFNEKKFVVGVDFSIEMLKRANGSFDERPFVVADADNLPFREESFDLVISFTLLQNMPEPKKTVSEMNRVVSPGGKVIATVLKKKYSPDIVRSWFKSAGLDILDYGEITNSEDVFCIGTKGNSNL